MSRFGVAGRRRTPKPAVPRRAGCAILHESERIRVSGVEKLTVAMENYLEAVYELSGGGGARVTDIAARMGVTKASANNAMAVLAEKGLIVNEKYSEIQLTPGGAELARAISHKHATIKRFLVQALGVAEDTAETDACAIEHVISRESVAAMARFLARS